MRTNITPNPYPAKLRTRWFNFNLIGSKTHEVFRKIVIKEDIYGLSISWRNRTILSENTGSSNERFVVLDSCCSLYERFSTAFLFR